MVWPAVRQFEFVEWTEDASVNSAASAGYAPRQVIVKTARHFLESRMIFARRSCDALPPSDQPLLVQMYIKEQMSLQTSSSDPRQQFHDPGGR